MSRNSQIWVRFNGSFGFGWGWFRITIGNQQCPLIISIVFIVVLYIVILYDIYASALYVLYLGTSMHTDALLPDTVKRRFASLVHFGPLFWGAHLLTASTEAVADLHIEK